jgi:hypothetical protein
VSIYDQSRPFGGEDGVSGKIGGPLGGGRSGAGACFSVRFRWSSDHHMLIQSMQERRRLREIGTAYRFKQ